MTNIRLPSCIVNAYSSALDLVESLTGSSNLDLFEAHIETNIEKRIDRKTICLGLVAPAAILSYFTPYPIAAFTIASLGLWFASSHNHMEAKHALVEKKIAQIITESAGKPKKALIIQSAADINGALSMRTHVEKIRSLAKTHSIERIVVNHEKEFFRSLPTGQFDVVWIRSHGTPTSIELGIDFELNKESPHKYFYILASRVKQNGKLILECCNVANTSKQEGSIAEHIASYCWEATVYAPSTKISGIFGLEFDKWGYPQFNDGFSFKGKPVTKVIEGPERKYLYLFA